MPLNLAAIKREHFEAFTDLLDHWKPANANNRFRRVQAFFKRTIPDGKIQESPAGAARRDAAKIRVSIDTGARLSEILDLRWIPADNRVSYLHLDRGFIRVQGKERRERILGIGQKTGRALVCSRQ